MSIALKRNKLAFITFAVFVAGVVIYAMGISTSYGTIVDWLYVLPTSVLSSLGMFLYQDDISELTGSAKSDNVFMAMYSLVHLMAACITSYLILRLIWRRLLYGWQIYWISNIKSSVDDLFVFWGINDYNLAMARDTFSHFQSLKTNKQPCIVFINVGSDDEQRENGFNVSKMLDIIHLTEDTYSALERIRAYICNYKEDVTIAMLAKLIDKSELARIFFLSGNENENISNATKIMDAFHSNDKLQVYCHARRSACSFSDLNHNKLHVIDSSYLSVMQLKQDVECQPVSVVDIDSETATVTGDFQSLIIGFGETGVEAFRFLFEFGAFVDKTGKKIPFNCTIIDKEASSKSGLLMASAPLLNLDTYDCEIDSEQYWNIIEKAVRGGLRYVVIAVGNDDTALDAAFNLCTLATRWRNAGSPNMKIFIRNYNQANFMRMKSFVDNINNRLNGISLNVFGSTQQIFSYDIVINDCYVDQAMDYNVAYKGKTEEVNNIRDIKERDKVRLRLWEEGTGLSSLSDSSTISDIEEIERKRDQNISNSLHAATKKRLLEKTDIPASVWTELDFERESEVVDGEVRYKTKYLKIKDKQIVTILYNLARLEHERWIAASILQGQQLPPDGSHKKDIVHKYHTDLVPWDDIRLYPHSSDEELMLDHLVTQGYDCFVVETSIRFKYKSKKDEKKD